MGRHASEFDVLWLYPAGQLEGQLLEPGMDTEPVPHVAHAPPALE